MVSADTKVLTRRIGRDPEITLVDYQVSLR